MAAATLLYTGFMLLSTVLLCMKNSYVGDIWSETAAMLAYSKLGQKLERSLHGESHGEHAALSLHGSGGGSDFSLFPLLKLRDTGGKSDL